MFVCQRVEKERKSLCVCVCVRGAVGISNICLTDWDTWSFDLLQHKHRHTHTQKYRRTHMPLCACGRESVCARSGARGKCMGSLHETSTQTHTVDFVQTSGSAVCSNGNRTASICISHPHTRTHTHTHTHTHTRMPPHVLAHTAATFYHQSWLNYY